jgi:hypothetical protein
MVLIIVLLGCIVILGGIFLIPRPRDTDNVERTLLEEEEDN